MKQLCLCVWVGGICIVGSPKYEKFSFHKLLGNYLLCSAK
jgi:hypothetical protein